MLFLNFTFCGPNGLAFELLGGCGAFGKSLAIAISKITFEDFFRKQRPRLLEK